MLNLDVQMSIIKDMKTRGHIKKALEDEIKRNPVNDPHQKQMKNIGSLTVITLLEIISTLETSDATNKKLDKSNKELTKANLQLQKLAIVIALFSLLISTILGTLAVYVSTKTTNL